MRVSLKLVFSLAPGILLGILFFRSKIANRMQLLVSVRDAAEAELVCRYPIERLDLKEPQLGSLGATSAEVWQTVISSWHQQVRISIALGELCDSPDPTAVPRQTDSIKVGLAGCSGLPDWSERLRMLYAAVPKSVSRVAVFYADQQLARCPLYAELLKVAADLKCATILVDTFGKTSGSVFEHLTETQLIQMRDAAHAIDCQFALAGSLRHHDLPTIKTIWPDIVAVRGALCPHDRTDQISERQLSTFVTAFEQSKTIPAGG